MRSFDVAAREAEVLGNGQRIPPLKPEDFDEEAIALFDGFHKSLGMTENPPVTNIFGTMLRHPGVYRCQLEMAMQLFGKGALKPRERELAILRVGWLCGAPYEWGEHVEIAKRHEVTGEEVERVTEGSAARGWSEHDAAILRGVEELLGNQMISDECWEILSHRWSDRQLIEFLALVGQYVSIAFMQNSLRIALTANNQGLRQR